MNAKNFMWFLMLANIVIGIAGYITKREEARVAINFINANMFMIGIILLDKIERIGK